MLRKTNRHGRKNVVGIEMCLWKKSLIIREWLAHTPWATSQTWGHHKFQSWSAPIAGRRCPQRWILSWRPPCHDIIDGWCIHIARVAARAISCIAMLTIYRLYLPEETQIAEKKPIQQRLESSIWGHCQHVTFIEIVCTLHNFVSKALLTLPNLFLKSCLHQLSESVICVTFQDCSLKIIMCILKCVYGSHFELMCSYLAHISYIGYKFIAYL